MWLPYFNFNSYMVRLKEDMKIKQYIREKFQFLYGTIKRSCPDYLTGMSLPFQFLYGTIKRLHNNPLGVGMKNFNSYMVRLKASWLILSKAILLFQFLYGTIKS